MLRRIALIVTTLLASATGSAHDLADSIQLTLPSEIDAVAGLPTQLNPDVVDGHPENNAVHPNAAGYRQVGTNGYSWMKCRMSESSGTASNSGDVFLLPYFLGNGETGVYFAYSLDGLKFEWLNDGRVMLPAPPWGDESLTRDPSILYRDGQFHMVWTTSWNALTIGYASSKDLIHWSKPEKIGIWQDRTDVRNTWAPELHWDPEEEEYFAIWSSTTLAELNDNDGKTDPHGYDHRTWVSRTKDFETWTKPELFFAPEPEHGVIDPFISHDDRNTSDPNDDRWVMVIKHEMAEADGGKNLRLTFSRKMQGPFETTLSPPIVGAGTTIVNRMGEGPSLFKRHGLWHLYWDAPGSDFSYCLATSPDLDTWTNRSHEMSLPAKQMRHGTVVVVPRRAVAKAMSETSP